MKKFIGLIVTAITSIVLYGFSAQKYKGSLGFGVGAQWGVLGRQTKRGSRI